MPDLATGDSDILLLMRLVFLIPLLLVMVLGGCSSSGTSPEFDVTSGHYSSAFDATRRVLRDYRFNLDRVDAQAGVITTQPKNTGGLASPWDREQSTVGQEVDDLVNHQRRVVRVTFQNAAGKESDTVDPTGAVRGRVEVTVFRMQSPGLRPSSRAISMTTVTVDPQAVAMGTGGQYEVPVSQDTRLAARIADEISKQMLKAPQAAQAP